MSALVLLLAAALSAPGELPEGAARYRVELSGEAVGVADLRAACAAPPAGRCTVTWEARLRLPAASGGVLTTRRVVAPVDRGGALAGAPAVTVDGRRLPTPTVRPAGAVPLSAAELILSARGGGCVEAVEEETGRSGQACARLEGRRLRGLVLGAAEEWTVGEDGLPERLELPGQRARYLRDGAAVVPAVPPPLEVRVPGPPEGREPSRFCGRAPDRPAPWADLSGLPEPRPDGSSCRAQAQAYAARVRRAGWPARIALGVAHDGAGFVWHAWVEVWTRLGWVPVDPAFGQLPARGPRFTVARHAADPAGLAEAGRRILACWGRAGVE